jgi:glutamate racemase
MDNRPIGIFDSGVGGLSVLLEIQKQLPNETAVFVADQAFVPYGEKTEDELVNRVSRIMELLAAKNVKAVVMACNTATVYTIAEMREKFGVPIIGAVPVVKTLGEISKTGKAAVFSTPATAKSQYLSELIAKFAPHVEIFKVGGTGLEQLVETGELNSPAIEQVLQTELPPLVEQGVDAIALGCTHYPFLRQRIQEIVGDKVKIVDSGAAVARRLNFVLDHEGLLGEQKVEDSFYTTGNASHFKKVAGTLMQRQIATAEHIDL